MVKQMVATLSVKGSVTSVEMLAERFAKVFTGHKLRPVAEHQPGHCEFTFAAAAVDMESALRGWKPTPRLVAEFGVTGALLDTRDEVVSITLQETEAPSDDLEMFPYERAAAIAVDLKAAIDALRKAGKVRLPHEPSKAELAADAARVERADRHAAMIEKFWKENAGAEEQFALNEMYQAFYDRHHQRKAG